MIPTMATQNGQGKNNLFQGAMLALMGIWLYLMYAKIYVSENEFICNYVLVE